MSDELPRIRVKAGREKAARNHHPWVYSGALESLPGLEPGTLVDLEDARGEFLARGFLNPRSQIAFRALSGRKEAIDAGFLRGRLQAALDLRRELGIDADAYRLVHGEGDRLPGLVVDRYGDWLAVQLGAAGMERLREPILDGLEDLLRPRGIWERSEGAARREEGLPERSSLARGAEPPERVEFREAGLRFRADLRRGQKTGFYLDQRPARAWVHRQARGRRVLDAFCFSGGFAVSAVAGGAGSVTAMDASEASLALVPEILEANGLDRGAVLTRTGDVFRLLRKEQGPYDLVVLDPPPFARRKADREGAARGYKDINLAALRLLAPGGLLLTSSCSHHVDARLFQQILFAAARDSGRPVQLIGRIAQPEDHPVSLYHPEGEYLKVFLLRTP